MLMLLYKIVNFSTQTQVENDLHVMVERDACDVDWVPRRQKLCHVLLGVIPALLEDEMTQSHLNGEGPHEEGQCSKHFILPQKKVLVNEICCDEQRRPQQDCQCTTIDVHVAIQRAHTTKNEQA